MAAPENGAYLTDEKSLFRVADRGEIDGRRVVWLEDQVSGEQRPFTLRELKGFRRVIPQSAG